jgi:hypothetical protein
MSELSVGRLNAQLLQTLNDADSAVQPDGYKALFKDTFRQVKGSVGAYDGTTFTQQDTYFPRVSVPWGYGTAMDTYNGLRLELENFEIQGLYTGQQLMRAGMGGRYFHPWMSDEGAATGYNHFVDFNVPDAYGQHYSHGAFPTRKPTINKRSILTTHGNANIAIGYHAMEEIQYDDSQGCWKENWYDPDYGHLGPGNNHIAIGHNAMKQVRNTNDGIAIGTNALSQAFGWHSREQVAIGNNALYCSRGNGNVAIGHNALVHLWQEFADENVAIGCGAAANYSGNQGDPFNNTVNRTRYCVYIGAYASPSGPSAQNRIVIGHRAIGNQDNSVTLGNNQITNIFANVTAISQLSDERLKENIEDADIEICKNSIKAIPVKRFSFKPWVGSKLDKTVTGFMAADVLEVFPKAITTADRTFFEVDDDGNVIEDEIENTLFYNVEKPVLDPDGNNTYDDDGRLITELVQEPHVQKELRTRPFTIEGVMAINPEEFMPQMWGALQWAIREIELLKQA